MRVLLAVIIGFIFLLPNESLGQDGLKVLITTAHPDDDAMFAGTVYRITHHLGGEVDLALMTDGAGGYRFSTFAEPIYGKKLTDEKIARQHIPAIRKQELMAGGAIVGVRNYFFIDQPDIAKKNDVEEVLNNEWDRDEVKDRLVKIMNKGDYDVVLAMLPRESTHGAHQAATISALAAAAEVSPQKRPIVLGGWPAGLGGDDMPKYLAVPGHTLTARYSEEVFEFDRNQKIGLDGRLNYNIIANWLIAEHKSQGTMQLFMGRVALENYWILGRPNVKQVELVRELFIRLAVPYGEEKMEAEKSGFWNPFEKQ